jgi:hypothetical protein
MFWSISESKAFNRCQRQWYFKNLLGNAVAKDPRRREAYLLGKLQSISAWRGQIVDRVISENVLPAIRSGQTFTLDQALARAKHLFDHQLAFGRQHRLRESGLSPAQMGDQFVAFYAMEYNGSLSDDELATAWNEIETAFNTLVRMRGLLDELRQATNIVTQRPLMFPMADMTVRAVPDAIAFFANGPPMIIDWKVHALGLHEAWTQLVTYGIALTRCTRHADFPKDHGKWPVTSLQLVEVQLLTNQIRRYTPSDEDIERTDGHIAGNVTRMLWAIENKKGKDVHVLELPVTSNPENCQRCPYRKICWENS